MNIVNNSFPRLLKLTATLLCSTLIAAGMATIASTLLLAATPMALPPFHVQEQWNLGGNGGWGFLALDAAAHRERGIPIRHYRPDSTAPAHETAEEPLGWLPEEV